MIFPAVVNSVVVRAVDLLAGAPPVDPLGPVQQDPDVVRAEACKLVSSNRTVCSPPPKPKPPNTSRDGRGLDLGIVSLLLWALLIVALVALVYLLVRRLIHSKGGRAPGRRKHNADDADLDVIERDAVAVDRSREPTNWRAEADAHRRAGRYRDALRCRYRALVGDLARRSVIDEIPGRTTGEERAQLRRATPTASAPFNAAADLFDAAWYGSADVGAVDDDRFQSLEHDVLATAVEPRR